MNTVIIQEPFACESGQVLSEMSIAYHTWGNLNEHKDNVVWICHALTANSDAADWWADMVGEGKCFDPEKYFIVCANYIGSCYGSTGPASINPQSNKPYYLQFPEITVRDMVRVHELLREKLEIHSIFAAIGGSIGGFQVMEWALLNPKLIKNLILIACSAQTSPWAIALNESQRLAIEADSSFLTETEGGGAAGLVAARSIALLSYRSGYAYNQTQAESDDSKISDFKAASYQRYQGQKLVKRFDAYSYYCLTKAIDSHHVGRGRGGREKALASIESKTLIISISSDQLFPPYEQKFLAEHIPSAEFHLIDSLFGHDGFLIEHETLSAIINKFLIKNRHE